MDVDAIRFPALAFARSTVFVFESKEEFTTGTKAGVRNGFFDGLALIDAHGQSFEVNGAILGDRLRIFSTRHHLHPIITASRPAPDIHEVKSSVLTALTHPRWTSVFGIEEIAEAVRSSTSVTEIIRALVSGRPVSFEFVRFEELFVRLSSFPRSAVS